MRDQKRLIPTEAPEERAILVGVELKRRRRGRDAFPLEESMAELARLAETAGLNVVGTLTQKLDRPHPATLIGKGKLEELKTLIAATGANVVVFDEELSPRQQRGLEEALGDRVKVLDRTALILDIFAQRARTKEGVLQVELAQYIYRLPRLTRAWTHLARQVGGSAGRGGIGGVGLRGPGETQLEVDRREIKKRIAQLRRELEEVRDHRELYRQRRREVPVPIVSLVGYTNAGKSTLLNALTDAQVYADDKLFATLDPTTRRVKLPGGQEILLTDTVGFIQKLPPQLVAAFRATLEEILEANVIVHVVDASHPAAERQARTVTRVLKQLGAGDKPVVVALNKVDLLTEEGLAEARRRFPDGVPISALKGWGLEELLSRIEEVLREQMVPISVHIPYRRNDLVALFHRMGIVEDERFTPQGTVLVGRVPPNVAGWLEPYRLDGRGSREAVTAEGEMS